MSPRADNRPQVVEALRKDPALADIPVILVTAVNVHDEEAKRCAAAGFPTKPFLPAVRRKPQGPRGGEARPQPRAELVRCASQGWLADI